jgi:hypothetical protein
MVFLLLAASFGLADASPQNWSGNYPPCNRHHDLLSREHVNLGVRISTSNPALARQFEHAMEFWSGVLDLDWHEEDSQNCSIQLVDGEPGLFESAGGCACVSARSQIPSLPAFQGWVAFNPGAKLTEREMFRVCVHEIGHLFGLAHNPSGSSVMYFFGLDGSESLDAADLDALASRHKLRPGVLEKGVIPTASATIP